MNIDKFKGVFIYLILLTGCVNKDKNIIATKNSKDNIESNVTGESILKDPKNLIRIKDMKFKPDNLEVKKGDTVYWINEDVFIHNIVESTLESWSSPELQKGEMWFKVITNKEDYYCGLHKIMIGSVNIITP